MRANTIMGIVLLLAGLCLAAGGAYVVHRTMEMERLAEVAWRQNDERCAAALRETGAVEKRGAVLEVRMSDLSDWRMALARASSAIAYCQTRSLTYFCAGSTCGGRAPAADGMLPARAEILFRMTGVERG